MVLQCVWGAPSAGASPPNAADTRLRRHTRTRGAAAMVGHGGCMGDEGMCLWRHVGACACDWVGC